MSSEDAGRTKTQEQGLGRRPGRNAETWLLARAKSVPNVLNQAPSWVRSAFDSIWEAKKAMAQQMRWLPPALWDYLQSLDGGFVAVCTGDSYYRPGPVTVRNSLLHNVAFVAIEDLARENERPLHVLGHLIDHYLGCSGEDAGPWLSEGGGVYPLWQQAGSRVSRLFALGYAVDEVAQSSVREYFAQSLALYCRDRERLNVADPQIDRWLHSTLWTAAFWQVASGTT